MKIAIPIAEGRLAMHFGHCQHFALVDVTDGQVVGREQIDAPPHQPGLLPTWLAERGVDVVIAGGMGHRAQSLFAAAGITVVIGAPALDPVEVVRHYLAETLETGTNPCDH